MENKKAVTGSRVITAKEILPLIRQVPLFASATEAELGDLGEAVLVHASAGTAPIAQNDSHCSFWVLLGGELRVTRVENDGGTNLLFNLTGGDTFGEGALMVGVSAEPARAEAVLDSTLLRLDADAFWHLMANCPGVRSGIVANMARRVEMYQTLTLHRQNIISLGTLSAGLMHELNNPGAAALRASAQLRENLTRLQQIGLRLTREAFTAEQMECLRQLQEQALSVQKPLTIGSIERADAEEALSEWLEGIGVVDAWRVAPTLVSVGWSSKNVECARHSFAPHIVSDTLHWLEALMSSLQVLVTIEETIGRVTDLVRAVKEYAHDDKDGECIVDIHDSLQMTLTVIGHKLRRKQLKVEKLFAAELPRIKTRGAGLSQAWTNLLENAIDASPYQGSIRLRTWTAGQQVCVGITDHGPGIPPEVGPHIFEPFFTTKPVGTGTGMGLHITHRIIVGNCAGQIVFSSEPGNTEFVIRLPISA